MSKQEDFGQPEKPLEKTREIDNEARISKEAEMKRKFNRNQKRVTLWDIQLSSLTSLINVKSILSHFFYIKVSAEDWHFCHKYIFGSWAIDILFWLNSRTAVLSKCIPASSDNGITDTQLVASLSWLISFSRPCYRFTFSLNSWRTFWFLINLAAIILLFSFLFLLGISNLCNLLCDLIT